MMLFLVILSSLVTMVTVTSQDQSCISSTRGLVLAHHVYMSFKTSDPLKCYHECTSDIKCQSINYYRNTQICEMNNRTAGLKPQYIRVDQSAVYLDNPYKNPDLACTFYTNITNATRNVKYGNPPKTDKCDKTIALGWYRLCGEAGVRMPFKCPPKQQCNTDAPGWLSDPHPTIEEGTISRKVCFHWHNNCCHWSRYINVRNCGGFYIYQFRPTPSCYLRYCGED
ncbi:pancreatic secretory granule membrane major glycoprotein GP2-like isoform X2 [Actinia tenebrosa]|uniref:Pancreatic secretory granule membrane major glycoprotein GP2-like isoform X2 n=1 Tax=Actinia tenebrosa TaxID=6105 RepID=A0A6P8HUR0_ACTTE|nr:pancreatic secretory granule membrane major glycoprotein GP2-like isoform X2 [Actinia tenebrosa]